MKRHRRSYWEKLVAELERGATVADVARRNQVREKTLLWWRTQIRRDARDADVRIVPVETARPLSMAPRHIEIVVGGAVLRVSEGADVAYIAALAHALSRTC